MVWLLAIIIGLCVIIWGASIAAKRDTVVEVDAPAAQALAAADSCFGLMWKQVYGSGHLNYARRFTYTGGGAKPTIAIAVLEDGRPADAPTCRVVISMSEWSQQYGAVFGADAVVLRKAWVARRLRNLSAGSQLPAQHLHPTPVPAGPPAPGRASVTGRPSVSAGHPAPPQVPPGAMPPHPGLHYSASDQSAPAQNTDTAPAPAPGTGYQRFPGVG